MYLGLNDLCARAEVHPDTLTKIINEIKTAISNGESVAIRGFGTFYPERQEARVFNTPVIDEPVSKPGEPGVRFRPSTAGRRARVLDA